VRSFVLAFLDATLNPATGALIVYLTGTVIALRTWPPQRPPSRREAARVMACRRALRVKGGWAA
jgi:hypothetical protein